MRSLGLAIPMFAALASGLITRSAFSADPPKPAPAPAKTAQDATDAKPADKPEAQAPSDAAPAAEDSTVQLRGLEERVNDLKEKIFRSKARLMLLRETVLNGAIAGAKAVIVHRNEMGASFVLENVQYSLDGAPIYSKTDKDGDLSDREEIELFNGSIVPGNHNISLTMVYRGNGFGIFSYLRGYTFRIKSSYAFTAEEGKITSVRVVGYEKGGITTDLRDRPAVRYDVEVKQDTSEAAPQPAAQASQAPAAQQNP